VVTLDYDLVGFRKDLSPIHDVSSQGVGTSNDISENPSTCGYSLRPKTQTNLIKSRGLVIDTDSLSSVASSSMVRNVDVLVVTRGIPSWKTFLREEEDSRSQRKTTEQLKNTPEEKSSHKKIIKWKYNFQKEKSAHRNNKVNMNTQNKKSASDMCPD
jgi:hypothetical protein